MSCLKIKSIKLSKNYEVIMKKTGNGKWIQNAIKHPGALREKLGVKKGEKIPAKKLEKATHSKNTTTKRQAILAETLKKMNRKGKNKK